MAKPGQIPYADALHAIALSKSWAGAPHIQWRANTMKGFPSHHTARIPLSIKNVIQEGFFVDLFHKRSLLPGIPDKVCMTLVTNGLNHTGFRGGLNS